jgi:hypothetical protein
LTLQAEPFVVEDNRTPPTTKTTVELAAIPALVGVSKLTSRVSEVAATLTYLESSGGALRATAAQVVASPPVMAIPAVEESPAASGFIWTIFPNPGQEFCDPEELLKAKSSKYKSQLIPASKAPTKTLTGESTIPESPAPPSLANSLPSNLAETVSLSVPC